MDTNWHEFSKNGSRASSRSYRSPLNKSAERGMVPLDRELARAKLRALGAGAALARQELSRAR